jgi:hypothetical protein
MRSIYINKKSVISNGGTIIAVELDPIPPGKTLVLRNIAGYHTNQATTEASVFYIMTGETIIYLFSGKPDVANYSVGRQVELPVPEGYIIGVVLPAAANLEVMRLYVVGDLYDTADYQNYDISGKNNNPG